MFIPPTKCLQESLVLYITINKRGVNLQDKLSPKLSWFCTYLRKLLSRDYHILLFKNFSSAKNFYKQLVTFWTQNWYILEYILLKILYYITYTQ